MWRLHVKNTGDIGLFLIQSETGIAAGVRRIEAVTGETALKKLQENRYQLETISQSLKTQPNKALEQIKQLQKGLKESEQKIIQWEKRDSEMFAKRAAKEVQILGDTPLLALKVRENTDLKSQSLMFQKELPDAVILLGKQSGEAQFSMSLSVPSRFKDKFHAGHIVRVIADEIDGRGGGKQDFAQCGGTSPKGWQSAVEKLKEQLQ